MRIHRWMSVLAAVAMLPAGAWLSRAEAQGITTGAVTGTVTDSGGRPLDAVQIRIRNKATGYVTGGLTREDGRYFVQGLEVGGPYEVTARRIGFQQDVRDNQYIALSQALRLDFHLGQAATTLSGVTVVASTAADFSPTNTGTKAIVSDTAIQRLPTLTRNLTDFIRLTPQVSQSGPGFSGGGMSNRMNNVQIDGASERDVFGLGSTGAPGAEVNAKNVSIEAVKEFQVLLAPFDVRQGNFGGLLLNAVTKSGTNQLQGSAFWFYRNEKFGADTSILRATPFERTQYGFSLGGPIIKDRLHFFIAPEFQKEQSPVTGPYFGQPVGSPQAFPINDADRQRFESIMATLGETQLGTAGYTNIDNPLSNMFARLDYRLNDVNRLVFRFNYAKGERLRQQNNRGTTTAVYSSNFHDFTNTKLAPVLQLFSNFKNGASNELFFGYNKWYNRRDPESSFPQIQINSGGVVGPNGNASIFAGADQFSQGNQLDTKTIELTENYTFAPRGNHSITVGSRNEYVWLRNLFTQSSYGVWSFRNLDSLAAGNPNTFRKAIVLADGGNVYFSAFQNALYAQDQWQVSPRFALTAGMRFDISTFLKDIAYNAAIDSAYGRRTDDIPKTTLQYSPRLGFNWDMTGNQANQLRGGAGLFVGTPPYVWLENAYVNSGNIITFLNCNTATTPAPAFQKDPTNINTCRNGAGTKPIGDVNLLAKDLKFPQPLRLSLAYDRRLPFNLVGTLEGLYSRTLNQLFTVSKNVTAPQGAGQGGRTLYITTVTTTNGARTLIPPPAVVANGGTARFSTAIDLQNQSKDYAYNLTAQLRKRYADNWEAMLAYTYSRARDVQSFTSSTAISNWQFGRTLSGRQEDAFTTISLFDQPHKILASGTYTLNWFKKLSTDFSVFYQGASGAPHDYIYGGAGGAGDLNGDGVQGNDLIYIPKNVNDPNEIRFRDITRTTGGVTTVLSSAANQATLLDAFINSSECLKDHRGEILQRNSCRQPFVNQVDVAIRQNIPLIADQRVSVQLDIFNFGNLLNKKWGRAFVTPGSANSNVPLVTHVGYVGAGNVVTGNVNANGAIPVVQFTPPAGGEYAPGATVSNFWRTQISMRYSF
jgi:outer membrane receptor for ferrienterochelin and colicin